MYLLRHQYSWLRLNLCSSRKWLRHRRSHMRYLIPLELCQSNGQFGDGLINFNKLFLKTLRLVAFRRLTSSLFHSIIVDGKKEFLKKFFNFLLVLDWKSYKINKVLIIHHAVEKVVLDSVGLTINKLQRTTVLGIKLSAFPIFCIIYQQNKLY